MQVIWFLIKASWKAMAIAITTGLISGISSAGSIAIVNTSLNSDRPMSWLYPFLGIITMSIITGIISRFVLIDLAQKSIYDVRIQLSRRILAAPFQRLEQSGASKLLVTLTDDVTSLSNSISIIPFLCIDLAIITSCLIYLAYLSSSVFVVTIVIIATALILIQFMILQANQLFRGARAENDRLLQLFRSITDGIKELKLNWQRRQEFIDLDLKESAGISRDRNIKALQIFSVAATFGQLIFFVSMGILIFVMPKYIQLTPAMLSGYVLTLTYLMSPFANMLEQLPALMRASVAIGKIESMGLILSEQVEIGNPPPATSRQVTSLELDNINHTYQGDEQNFHLGSIAEGRAKPNDLKFSTDRLIFIVGGNGSGKSTLAKLLTGLYIPEIGEIKLNGETIDSDNREWYRQHFSVVFGDFFLFEKLLGTGKDVAKLDAEAQDYLQLLQIEHKVQIKDGVLSTTNLSQGQRKRLALLTAYLEDRPIFLFDEWAADQDPIFRDIFYHQLLPDLKQRGKLVFAISHDDRYFHLADSPDGEASPTSHQIRLWQSRIR
jgi:putative pyoverdin transport system ATP-binding/permease protein